MEEQTVRCTKLPGACGGAETSAQPLQQPSALSTDAAGGYADGDTAAELRDCGLTVDAVLRDNDAYHALQKTGGLIVTGATGTNVNDVAVALING